MRGAAGRARAAKLGLSASLFGRPPATGGRRMTTAEIGATLTLAADEGLKWLHAGRDDAEAALARAAAFTTGLRLCIRAAAGRGDADLMARRAQASLDRLAAPVGDALVIAAHDLAGPDGEALWTRMRRLQDAGAFRLIGVSARAVDDPLALARRFEPDLMQLPLSLLDQRLVQSGALSEIAERGVEVHLRSVLADGLLFLPRDGLPPAVAETGPRLSRIRRTIAEAGADPLRAALAFALGRPEASAVIVSVTSCAELRALVAAAASAPLLLDWPGLALDHPQALDRDLESPKAVAA